MRQVAQPRHLGQHAPFTGVDDGQGAAATLDDDAEVAGALGGIRGSGGGARTRGEQADQREQQRSHRVSFGKPASRRSAIQRASSALSIERQGGIGVPGRPW